MKCTGFDLKLYIYIYVKCFTLVRGNAENLFTIKQMWMTLGGNTVVQWEFFQTLPQYVFLFFFFPFSIEISLLSQLKRISHVLDGNKSSTKC